MIASLRSVPLGGGAAGREIVLARHGTPHFDPWVWTTPRYVPHWTEVFDRADVRVDGVPAETLDHAGKAAIVVSSTLPRSVQSARALSPDRGFLTEAVFCEVRVPHTDWAFPSLPLWAWVTVFRLAWFLGFSAGAESFTHATVRARIAAQRLARLAEESGSVFLVGHGIMTMLIAKHLVEMGWTGPRRPVNRHWQFCVYRRPA